jgi:hypothetical protein
VVLMNWGNATLFLLPLSASTEELVKLLSS